MLTLNVHQAKGMSYSLASLKSISNSDGLHRSGKQSLSANPFKTALAENQPLNHQYFNKKYEFARTCLHLPTFS